MNISCANKSSAGILGVFYARIQAKHVKSGEIVETKSMIYVIEGDTLLLSKKVLKDLGCVSRRFPSAGEFLTRAVIDKAVAKTISLLEDAEDNGHYNEDSQGKVFSCIFKDSKRESSSCISKESDDKSSCIFKDSKSESSSCISKESDDSQIPEHCQPLKLLK